MHTYFKSGLMDETTVNNLLQIDDQAFFKDVVSTFKKEAPALLLEAKKHLKDGDTIKTRELLHQLKGSCGTIGAKRASETILEMGSKLKIFKIKEAENLVPALKSELKETISAIEDVYLK